LGHGLRWATYLSEIPVYRLRRELAKRIRPFSRRLHKKGPNHNALEQDPRVHGLRWRELAGIGPPVDLFDRCPGRPDRDHRVGIDVSAHWVGERKRDITDIAGGGKTGRD